MYRKPVYLIPWLLTVLVLAGCAGIKGEELPGLPITAFVHVDLIPMTEDVVLEEQTVLVEGDRIVALGPSDEIKVPRTATVINGRGFYLMPGLADMHVHIYEESRKEYPISPLNLYIANGVTTIRDCGTAPIQSSDKFVLDWRDQILRGELIGPMIYSSGRTIHGPVASPDWTVRARHANGFDFVKLYMELSIDEFEEAQSAAEELGIYTVGHIPYQVGFDRAISAGLDEIAHIEELSFELLWSENRPKGYLSVERWLQSIVEGVIGEYDIDPNYSIRFNPEEFIRLRGHQLNRILDDLRANGIGVGTTLAVYEVVDLKVLHQEKFFQREENIYLQPELIDSVLSGHDRHQLMYQMLGESADIWKWKRDLDVFLLHALHEAGVMLVSGTDAGSTSIGVVEGFTTHDDLRILTELGFTPYEALQTATVNAAHVVEKMKGTGDFGTVEIGKRADLILLEGNPLADITYTESILGVMAMGKWYPQEELQEMIAISD